MHIQTASRAARLCCTLLALALLLTLLPAAPLRAETPPDDAFEAYLTAQRFPDSYRAPLRALHDAHPSWIFTAQHINLTWTEVLTAQCVIGRSLVSSGSSAAWKSFEKGAYDFQKDAWIGLDGSSWVAASPEVVAYYLDPRNGLRDSAVFQFENLAHSGRATAAGVDSILSTTFMTGSYTCRDTGAVRTYTQTVLDAASESGVSAYHIAARLRQEQGRNGNALAHGTVAGYEGYYNFFNIRAYATSTLSAMQNGAGYAAGTDADLHRPWTNQYKSITGGSIFLGRSYIAREQNTLYLQKFDVTDGGNGYYSHQYMTNISGAVSEASIMKSAYTSEIMAGAIEFLVPVYLDMPGAPCPEPPSSGDNNNLLSALTVPGYTLTPAFDRYVTAYSLVVDTPVATLNVAATPGGAAATVTGAGAVTLKPGDNTVTLTVTATSGAKRTYTLSIYRTPGTPPTVASDVYRVEQYLTGVSPGTTAAALLAELRVTGGDAVLLDASGKPVDSGAKLATGQRLQLRWDADHLADAIPLVIRGDPTGDGDINVQDLLRAQRHLLKLTTLTDCYAAAADANCDGIVDIRDLLRTQRHVLGLTVIEQ